MNIRNGLILAPLAIALGLVRCGGDDDGPTGPSQTSCGGGQGATVAFCRQVDHYEAGFGVAGQDFIHVTCIAGPSGATVTNAANGTYSCGGTYKLTTFATAVISLNWGGSTSFSDRQEFQVPARGEGSFSVRITKISGGEGNLFFSMSSGSSWMFDTVPVNSGCAAVVGAAGIDARAAIAPSPALPPPGAISTAVERVYNPDGARVTGKTS